jgi:alpha-tubulin suppressor-like RCC1 family protein
MIKSSGKLSLLALALGLFVVAPQIYAANKVVAWGAGMINKPADGNDYGQSIIPITLTNAVFVAAGWRHSLALNADGTLTGWGDDSLGQTDFPVTSNYMAIACGYLHSLALQSNSTVLAAGNDGFGQTEVPVNLSNVAAIACGFYHSLALQSNGTVVAWGPSTNAADIGKQPDFGQTLVPAGLSNVVAIAGGGWHSLALKSDGTMVAWGAGTIVNPADGYDYGQSIIPAGLSNVVAIAAGAAHTLVLEANGTLVAWGNNTYGQTNIPAGLSNVVAIAAGGWHNLALKSDGTVVAWGAGVGNNASVDFKQNIVPPGLSNVTQIAAGALNSLALLPVLQSPLTVLTNGNGGISPNYNGYILQIGSMYSMTAKPAKGFTFANWTDGLGNVLTNGVTLTFIMVSNLTLVANFKDTILPTLTITAPKANQKWSNALFTVTGTAKDNVAVSNVLFSLNHGGWTSATLSNGGSNWTAQVTLIPATNTIQAFAVNILGNVSKTNTVKMDYILTTTLTVLTNGEGGISPAYNGKLLLIGTSYQMTARADAGFGITDWTGGLGNVLTNGATLRFVMASNLTFVANFTDITRPTLTITAPKANQKWSNAVLSVQGRASDNVAVAAVWVQLNNDNWTNAMTDNGWTNWNVSLNLAVETNTVRAYAVDTSGNHSLTNTVRFIYAQSVEPVLANVSPIPQPPLQFECGGGSRMVTNGCLQLRLSGTTGTAVVVERSSDLMNWVPIQTNTVPEGGLPLLVPLSQQPEQFFRARKW